MSYRNFEEYLEINYKEKSIRTWDFLLLKAKIMQYIEDLKVLSPMLKSKI